MTAFVLSCFFCRMSPTYLYPEIKYRTAICPEMPGKLRAFDELDFVEMGMRA